MPAPIQITRDILTLHKCFSESFVLAVMKELPADVREQARARLRHGDDPLALIVLAHAARLHRACFETGELNGDLHDEAVRRAVRSILKAFGRDGAGEFIGRRKAL